MSNLTQSSPFFPLFIILIPIVIGICTIFSLKKFKQLLNPIALIVFWWGGWLLIANFSLTGLYIPSVHTQLLIILFLIFYTLGGILYFPPKKGIISNKFNITNTVFYIKFKPILNLVQIILFACILPFFLKSLVFFGTEGYYKGYRQQIYGSVDAPSILYGSNAVELLSRIFVLGLLAFFTIISIIFFFEWSIKKYFIYALILNFMQSFMTFGRVEVYFLVLYLFLAAVLFIQRSNPFLNFPSTHTPKIKIKQFRKYIVLGYLLLTIGFLMVFSGLRNPAKGSALDGTWYFLITYHTTGYAILSQELENSSSFLHHSHSFGNATLWGIDYLFSQGVRRFNRNYNSYAFQYVNYTAQYVPVAYSGHKSNALYPMLWAFYADGKELWVAFMSIVLGYLSSWLYLDWRRTHSLFTVTYLLLLLRMIMVSMLSFQANAAFWLILISLIFIQRAGFTLSFPGTNLLKTVSKDR